MKSLGPSFAHVGLATLLFGVGAGLWMLGLRGPHWQGAFIAVAYAWSRELAQKWRSITKPGPPLTMDNIRQAAWPSGVVIASAIAIEIFYQP
jgi:hypothetical protein